MQVITRASAKRSSSKLTSKSRSTSRSRSEESISQQVEATLARSSIKSEQVRPQEYSIVPAGQNHAIALSQDVDMEGIPPFLEHEIDITSYDREEELALSHVVTSHMKRYDENKVIGNIAAATTLVFSKDANPDARTWARALEYLCRITTMAAGPTEPVEVRKYYLSLLIQRAGASMSTGWPDEETRVAALSIEDKLVTYDLQTRSVMQHSRRLYFDEDGDATQLHQGMVQTLFCATAHLAEYQQRFQNQTSSHMIGIRQELDAHAEQLLNSEEMQTRQLAALSRAQRQSQHMSQDQHAKTKRQLEEMRQAIQSIQMDHAAALREAQEAQQKIEERIEEQEARLEGNMNEIRKQGDRIRQENADMARQHMERIESSQGITNNSIRRLNAQFLQVAEQIHKNSKSQEDSHSKTRKAVDELSSSLSMAADQGYRSSVKRVLEGNEKLAQEEAAAAAAFDKAMRRSRIQQRRTLNVLSESEPRITSKSGRLITSGTLDSDSDVKKKPHKPRNIMRRVLKGGDLPPPNEDQEAYIAPDISTQKTRKVFAREFEEQEFSRAFGAPNKDSILYAIEWYRNQEMNLGIDKPGARRFIYEFLRRVHPKSKETRDTTEADHFWRRSNKDNKEIDIRGGITSLLEIENPEWQRGMLDEIRATTQSQQSSLEKFAELFDAKVRRYERLTAKEEDWGNIFVANLMPNPKALFCKVHLPERVEKMSSKAIYEVVRTLLRLERDAVAKSKYRAALKKTRDNPKPEIRSRGAEQQTQAKPKGAAPSGQDKKQAAKTPRPRVAPEGTCPLCKQHETCWMRSWKDPHGFKCKDRCTTCTHNFQHTKGDCANWNEKGLIRKPKPDLTNKKYGKANPQENHNDGKPKILALRITSSSSTDVLHCGPESEDEVFEGSPRRCYVISKKPQKADVIKNKEGKAPSESLEESDILRSYGIKEVLPTKIRELGDCGIMGMKCKYLWDTGADMVVLPQKFLNLLTPEERWNPEKTIHFEGFGSGPIKAVRYPFPILIVIPRTESTGTRVYVTRAYTPLEGPTVSYAILGRPVTEFDPEQLSGYAKWAYELQMECITKYSKIFKLNLSEVTPNNRKPRSIGIDTSLRFGNQAQPKLTPILARELARIVAGLIHNGTATQDFPEDSQKDTLKPLMVDEGTKYRMTVMAMPLNGITTMMPVHALDCVDELFSIKASGRFMMSADGISEFFQHKIIPEEIPYQQYWAPRIDDDILEYFVKHNDFPEHWEPPGLVQTRSLTCLMGVTNGPSISHNSLRELIAEVSIPPQCRLRNHMDDVFGITQGESEDDLEAMKNHEKMVFSFLDKCAEINTQLNLCKFVATCTRALVFSHLWQPGYLSVGRGYEGMISRAKTMGDLASVARSINFFKQFAMPHKEALREMIKMDGLKATEQELEAARKKMADIAKTFEDRKLRLDDWTSDPIVYVDWSIEGIGAILSTQEGEPMKMLTAKNTPAARDLSPVEGEIYAICEAVEAFRYHLMGRHFYIYSDSESAVKAITLGKQKNLMRAYVARRWRNLLNFTFSITHIEGIQNPADAPSRIPRQYARELGDHVVVMPIRQKVKVTKNPYEEYSTYTPTGGASEEQLIKALDNRVNSVKTQEGRVMAIHEYLGHPGVDRTYDILTKYRSARGGLDIKKSEIREWIFSCKICNLIRPAPWLVKYGHEERAIKPYEIIDLDSTHIAGPFWLIIARDQLSAHFWAVIDWRKQQKSSEKCPYDKKKLDKATELMQLIMALAECDQSTVSMIRTDQGSEFSTKAFRKFLAENDIEHKEIPVGKKEGTRESIMRCLKQYLVVPGIYDPEWPRDLAERIILDRVVTIVGMANIAWNAARGGRPRDLLRGNTIVKQRVDEHHLRNKRGIFPIKNMRVYLRPPGKRLAWDNIQKGYDEPSWKIHEVKGTQVTIYRRDTEHDILKGQAKGNEYWHETVDISRLCVALRPRTAKKAGKEKVGSEPVYEDNENLRWLDSSEESESTIVVSSDGEGDNEDNPIIL